MQIEAILKEEEKAQNNVAPTGQYSFLIDLVSGQQFNLPNYITGSKKYTYVRTRAGDQLSFDYNFQGRSVVYEANLSNTNEGTERFIEDGEFTLTSREDVDVLEKDIALKIQLFKSILQPYSLQTITEIYKNLLSKIKTVD